jgi:hypothetical protein
LERIHTLGECHVDIAVRVIRDFQPPFKTPQADWVQHRSVAIQIDSFSAL